MRALVFVAALCLVPAYAVREAAAQDASAALVDVFAAEPSLAQVQAMVVAAAPGPMVDVRRMRRSAWLPERVAIDVGGSLDGTFRDENVVDQDYDEVLAPDSSGTRWLQREDDAQSVDLGLRVEWNLTRLAWDADELRAADAVVDAVRAGAEQSREVTALWAERREAQIALLLAPTDEIGERARLMVVVERLTGEIDALTAGAFRAALPSAGG